MDALGTLDRAAGRPPRMPVMAGNERVDARLVARVADGDEQAMRAMHAEYGAAVFGLLRRMIRDRGIAEDVFQQVMLEAWQRAASYDPDRGSVAAWLLTLARSRAIDELRRRRPEPVDPSALEAAVGDDPHGDRWFDRWEVAAALRALPDEERDLLEMRFRLDLSQTEIADRTGVPLGTVKTRMNRALRRLRGVLAPSDGGER